MLHVAKCLFACRLRLITTVFAVLLREIFESVIANGAFNERYFREVRDLHRTRRLPTSGFFVRLR